MKSSPLKAAPNGFEPTSPEARAALASIVEDSYAWFKDLVKKRRALTDPQLAAVDDGRVFTGRQGIGLHLVDRLGGEQEAIAWLEQEKSVPKGLKVRDWKPSGTGERLGLFSLASASASFFHLDGLSHLMAQGEQYAQGRVLDGLVSIWQVTARIDLLSQRGPLDGETNAPPMSLQIEIFSCFLSSQDLSRGRGV